MIKTMVTGQSQAAVVQIEVTGAPDLTFDKRVLAPARLIIRYGLRQGHTAWVVSGWDLVAHRRLKDGGLGNAQKVSQYRFVDDPDWITDAVAHHMPKGMALTYGTGYSHYIE